MLISLKDVHILVLIITIFLVCIFKHGVIICYNYNIVITPWFKVGLSRLRKFLPNYNFPQPCSKK